MLIELWERLRGYDKWVEAEATVESSELIDRLSRRHKPAGLGRFNWNLLVNPWQANCRMAWHDASGVRHVAHFAAEERTALFQKYEGQKVSIRYNPADPNEYYIREGVRQRALFKLANWIFLFYLLIVCILLAIRLFQTFERIFRR